MRRRRRSNPISNRLDHLEGRELRAGGAAGGGLDVVRNLGVLTAAAAISGVEATATIAPHGSVTFDFRAQAGGMYTLFVRYEGQGLSLDLISPGRPGSLTVRPGPPGPFAALSLPLGAQAYSIRASALGDRPVFVDWEVFLDSGVGQAPAGLVARSEAIPLPGPTSAPSPGTAPASASMAIPAAASPARSAPKGAPATSVVLGGPIGRSGIGRPSIPAATAGTVGPALAFAGPILPDGLILGPAEGPGLGERPGGEVATIAMSGPAGRPIPTLELLDDAEAARQDRQAMAPFAWIDRLAAGWGGSRPGPDGLAGPFDEDVAAIDPPSAQGGPESGVGPGLEMTAATGIVAALALRSRRARPGRPAEARRRIGPDDPTIRAGFSPSMA